MATSLPSEEKHEEILAEEMVKHILLKNFGIYWEANSPKLPLKDYYTACVLLGEAVTTGWKKFYAAVEGECNRVYKNLGSSPSPEQIYASLKDVAAGIDLTDDFVLFVVMAVFGELCVRISKSGAESLISTAVSGAKRYLVDEGFADVKRVQMSSVNFMEFCDGEKS